MSDSTPARASSLASARTWTFMPPESPTPGGASGEEWTESTATLRTPGSPQSDAWPLLPGNRTSRGSPSRLADRFRGARGDRSSPSTGVVMLLVPSPTGIGEVPERRSGAGTGSSTALRALRSVRPLRRARVALRGGGVPSGGGGRGGGSQPGPGIDPAAASRVRLGAGPEGRVHVDQHLLLPLAQVRVALDRVHQAGLLGPLVEDARPDVEGLGADPQRLGDVLEDLGGGLAQPALDLRQVRVGDARQLGQVAHRQLRLAPLVADVAADVADLPSRVELVEAIRHGDASPLVASSPCQKQR